MKTGELARASGVSPDVVRYYERRGLLRPAARTAANYRRFSPEAIDRVTFVRGAQRLGFTLAEIGMLLALPTARGADCDAVREIAVRKVKQLDQEIRQLREIRRDLVKLLRGCQRDASAGTGATVHMLRRI